MGIVKVDRKHRLICMHYVHLKITKTYINLVYPIKDLSIIEDLTIVFINIEIEPVVHVV